MEKFFDTNGDACSDVGFQLVTRGMLRQRLRCQRNQAEFSQDASDPKRVRDLTFRRAGNSSEIGGTNESFQIVPADDRRQVTAVKPQATIGSMALKLLTRPGDRGLFLQFTIPNIAVENNKLLDPKIQSDTYVF